MKNMKKSTRALCEGAILIALATILSLIKLYQMPSGGSIDCAMLPVILFAVRWGVGPGTGAGFVYGLLQYFVGSGFAIDWATIIGDYIVAYTFLGFGAGLLHGRRGGVWLGTVVGGLLRFAVHLFTGAVIWGKWMPDTFLGMTMTNEWFYSFLYNGSYIFPDIVIVLLLFTLLSKPLGKYFRGEDLK